MVIKHRMQDTDIRLPEILSPSNTRTWRNPGV